MDLFRVLQNKVKACPQPVGGGWVPNGRPRFLDESGAPKPLPLGIHAPRAHGAFAAALARAASKHLWTFEPLAAFLAGLGELLYIDGEAASGPSF